MENEDTAPATQPGQQQEEQERAERIRAVWENGKAPAECIGKCDIRPGFLMDHCSACNWDNY